MQTERRPAASSACAWKTVVLWAATVTGMLKAPELFEVPLATAVPEQSVVVKRSTVKPGEAPPRTVGVVVLPGEAGSVCVREGALGGGACSRVKLQEYAVPSALPAISITVAASVAVQLTSYGSDAEGSKDTCEPEKVVVPAGLWSPHRSDRSEGTPFTASLSVTRTVVPRATPVALAAGVTERTVGATPSCT